MESKDHGAREEFLAQLVTEVSVYFSRFNRNKDADEIKDRILGITLDPYQALQKQNAELLEALETIVDCQFNPSKTLANLNGAISNANDIIKKAKQS